MNQINQDVSNDAAEKAEIPLSREDQDSIRILAQELRAPVDLVTKLYGRELARLRPNARVTTFLALVVSRLVRRRRVELASAHES